MRLANPSASSYLLPMGSPDAKRRNLGLAALLIPLFAILVAALWFASRAWTAVSGPPMPGIGYLAMTLGIIFSLIIGCGLMALLFYSSRHGYDEPTRIDYDEQE